MRELNGLLADFTDMDRGINVHVSLIISFQILQEVEARYPGSHIVYKPALRLVNQKCEPAFDSIKNEKDQNERDRIFVGEQPAREVVKKRGNILLGIKTHYQ